MALSPEIRARKIKEAAAHHDLTPSQIEDHLRNLKSGVNAPESVLLDKIIEMAPGLLQRPG